MEAQPWSEAKLSIESAVARSFLAGVDQDLVARLLQGARLHEVAAGRVFIDQSRSQRAGLVVSGLARVFTVGFDGAQWTVRRVGPGATVGIRAIPGHDNRLTVQAISDVEFHEFDAQRLIGLAREHVSLAMALAEEIDRRLEDVELQAESHAVGTVLQKVAGALLDLSVEGEVFDVELSQEALAEIAGSSRERVGHELRLLASNGWIRMQRARITLLDPLELQTVARNPAPRGRRA